jgi:hypothetical protein
MAMRENPMTYATAMVSLAVNRPNEALLEVSGQLAAQFSAKMIGVASAMFSPPLYFMGEAGQHLIDEGEAAIRKRMAELEDQFRAAMHGRAKEIEWRSALELPARYVARQSRAADLVIVGGDGNAMSDPFASAGPSDLVMQAGRPLLVVPAAVKWLDLRSALVAWKDCPEARRAVADALPLLAKAKEVTIAGIAEEGGRPGGGCASRPRTSSAGCCATAFPRAPRCRSEAAMRRRSSSASPPTPVPGLSWRAPMAVPGSANGCWAASPSIS